MKLSELCKMIENSIHSHTYPHLTDNQKTLANLVQVINRSNSEDLHSNSIIIEVRIREFYFISNYVSNMQHLPGIIELDVLDSFKMLCRKIERLDMKI
jgi:negative regulator of sigma E activity